jgi:NAD-dependent dihydropyrimidine dehydrogenase PreA subunit
MAAAAELGKADAVYRRTDGLVIFDPAFANDSELASALVTSCPFGAAYHNEDRGLAQKCTGCAHLVDAGELPHCVDVCPHQTLRFGEEEELLANLEEAKPLLESDAALACKPRVYYLNKPERFLGGIVVDLEEDEVVIGARVTIEDTVSGTTLATETDDFGDFWFDQIPAATWQVYVEAEGYLTRVVQASTIDEDRSLDPIALSQAAEAAE